MSVQVRRRREAASFLSAYVGAQGELIVDTTNNRVQVHDGIAPGGWPAAGMTDLPGRNALINGNLSINQRGQVSGSALAAAAYGHDRWKAGASGCTYTFTQGATDTTLTITAGSLIQAVDTGNVYATSMWLTWAGSASARVWQGSASGAFSAGAAYTDPVDGAKKKLFVTGLALGTVANVEFQGGTIGLVQLEAALPGAGPTRFERRHGEMALCQRYYEVLGIGGAGGTNGSSAVGIIYRFATIKRAAPTMTGLASAPSVLLVGALNATASNAGYSFQSVDPTAFLVNISGFSNLPGGTFPTVTTSSNIIAASAEL